MLSWLFFDNLNNTKTFHTSLSQNATSKAQEGGNASGHLPKKWLYNWKYTFEGDWQLAFYCIPPGNNYPLQSGRAACKIGDMRLIAKKYIP